jgi:hypothetical protein
MKLDPGMHIGLHLIFFGKTGVTIEETTYHTLVECSLAQAFWAKLKQLEGTKLPRLRSRTWPEDLLDDTWCRKNERIILLCGMWSLWNTRNDYHHGKKPINPALSIDWAMDVCYHLLIAQQNTRVGQVTREANWQSPPAGVVKLNCDGGFQATEMKGSQVLCCETLMAPSLPRLLDGCPMHLQR